jgi:hypothetical protein
MSRDTYLISTQSYLHARGKEEETPLQHCYLLETDFAGDLRKIRIETPTDNPGGERIKGGLRGISIWRGQIYVATWNSILVIRYPDLRIVDTFDHPLMSDLHGLHVDDHGIWITNTLIDVLLKFDHDRKLKGVLTFSDTKLYPRAKRTEADLTQDYRLRGKRLHGFLKFHANHVQSFDDKTVLVTGRGHKDTVGRVIKVDRETLEWKPWITKLKGPHDGLFIRPGCYAVTETDTSAIALIDTDRWRPKVTKRLYVPGGGPKFWTRGLCQGRNGHLFAGRSVWKGDPHLGRVAEFDAEGNFVAEHELPIDDYPECRVFQVCPAPRNGDA